MHQGRRDVRVSRIAELQTATHEGIVVVRDGSMVNVGLVHSGGRTVDRIEVPAALWAAFVADVVADSARNNRAISMAEKEASMTPERA